MSGLDLPSNSPEQARGASKPGGTIRDLVAPKKVRGRELELGIGESRIKEFVHRVIMEQFELNGAPTISCPWMVPREIVEMVGKRNDLLKVQEVYPTPGSPEILEGMVIAPENTAGAAYRILLEERRQRQEQSEIENKIVYPYLFSQWAHVARAEQGSGAGQFTMFEQVTVDCMSQGKLARGEMVAQDFTIMRIMSDSLNALIDLIDTRVGDDMEPRVGFRVTNSKLLEGALRCFGVLHYDQMRLIAGVLDKINADSVEEFSALSTEGFKKQGIYSDLPDTFLNNNAGLKFIWKLRHIKADAENWAEVNDIVRALYRDLPGEDQDEGRRQFAQGHRSLIALLQLAARVANTCRMRVDADLSLIRTCPIIYDGNVFEIYLCPNTSVEEEVSEANRGGKISGGTIGSVGGGGRCRIVQFMEGGEDKTITGGGLGITRVIEELRANKAFRFPASVHVLVTLKNRMADEEGSLYFFLDQTSGTIRAHKVACRVLTGDEGSSWTEERLIKFARDSGIPYIYYSDTSTAYDVKEGDEINIDPSRFAERVRDEFNLAPL